MVAAFVKKLWKADDFRRSRFHDGWGGLISPDDLLWIPQRIVENILKRRGIYSPVPWWPPKATKAIDGLLRRDWTVLEFGAGMSSTWLAKRAGHVTSIEHDREWAERVRASAVRNLTILDRDRSRYLDVPAGPFDLVVVDAIRRADCVAWALDHVKPGGFIYLDNSDVDKDGGQGGVNNLARHRVQQAVSQGKGTVEYFRGYPPGQLAPCEGALFQSAP
jgi:hypothetical protein